MSTKASLVALEHIFFNTYVGGGSLQLFAHAHNLDCHPHHTARTFEQDQAIYFSDGF